MSQFILALLIILSFLTGPAYAGNLSFDSYYHNDHLGSPVAVTDERGDLLWRAHFRPYGERHESPADASFGNIGYTGHTQDADSGLVYMQARYYDPVIGRFMAIDPEGVNPESPISFNRYAYANSNPMRFIDPDGRMSKELPGGGTWASGFETRTLVGDGGWGPITGTKRGLTPQGELVNGSAVKGVPKKAPDITTPYKRPSGATTKAQRESVQGKPCVDCGATTPKQYADHKDPLVKEYYRTGAIDKARMRDIDSVQSQCPTCSNKQGAELSRFSRQQKKDLGL